MAPPTATSPVATGKKPSCQNCPAFLRPNDQNKVLGTNIGGDMCGRKLIAIGRPGQNAGAPVAQVTASKCDDFGKPIEEYDANKARTTAINLNVAMPVPPSRPRDPETVRTCKDCSHYVPSTMVAPALGWNAGYCRANGTLLLEDRLASYARGCPVRSVRYTQPNLRTSEVMLFPEYKDGYGARKLTELLVNRSVDPQTIDTQAPVSAIEAKHGVRAWRLIEDPDGYGPAIKLPIFAREFFTDPVSQSKIPVIGDQERPEDYVDHGGFTYKVAALWMELDETPALWGPAGVGKTELFRHFAFLMGLPFERISITGSSEIDDLAGKPGYSPERGTFFTYGRIPRAWTRPNVICVDEPNAGPPEVWQFIRPMTDNSKQLVLDQNNGERLIRHPSCYLGMAMNPAWDPRNTGVASLADADGSRLMHIFMDIPPADVEEAIIKRALQRDGWDDAAIKAILPMVMQCASDIRALSVDGTVAVSWGLRSQIKVARAMRFFSPISAYRVGVADSLEPAAQQAILDVVKSKFEE